MASFTSAFLGEVQHPKNTLHEYLAAFKNKCQADILSWLDKWTRTKRVQGKEDWIWLVTSSLAKELSYCKDTIFRHLDKLLNLGVIDRRKANRWACDQAYEYRIVPEKLALFALFEGLKNKFSLNLRLFACVADLLSKSYLFCADENQTIDVKDSDQQQPENRPPTVQNQPTYINTIPIPPSNHTQIDDVDAEEETESEEIEKQKVTPTDEEVGQACAEIRALSPEFQLNLNVKNAIFLNWANLPAVLTYLKEAVRTWKVRPGFNWTGLLVKSLKSGVAKQYEPPPKEYPRPTLEQLNVLGTIGQLVHTRFDKPGSPEVLCVEVEGRGLLAWWDALKISACGGGAV